LDADDDLVIRQIERLGAKEMRMKHSIRNDAQQPRQPQPPLARFAQGFAACITPQLAEGERTVGQNLHTRHSVGYDALPAWFLGFAWIIDDEVQPWDLTLMRFEELGIMPVPTLWRGPCRAGLFETIAAGLDPDRQEGFVERVAAAFPEGEMPCRMGKYVRAGHVQSETRWMHAPLVPNGLRAA